ncbi:hypothetical protein BH20ACT23_BH20ACT23_09770 [soil metagenome]
MTGLGGRTRSAPGRSALICGGRSLSFAELEELQARLARNSVEMPGDYLMGGREESRRKDGLTLL